MQWEPESEAILKQVPFFVRKMVRRKVEEYAASLNHTRITPEIVNAAKQRALPGGVPDPNDRFAVIRKIENLPPDQKKVPMYVIDSCRGAEVDCPNSVCEADSLTGKIREVLEASGITEHIIAATSGPLLSHHRFKVSISSCPNACSQAQIKDVGIIAQLKPTVAEDGACRECGECVDTCREEALTLGGDSGVELDTGLCLYCGKCISACPSEVLEDGGKGYALYIGGRLGRHPRLADKIANLLSVPDLLRAIQKIGAFYKEQATSGERFSRVVERLGADFVARAIGLAPKR